MHSDEAAVDVGYPLEQVNSISRIKTVNMKASPLNLSHF